jgi:cytochrome c-type biogenesis protein CcmF
MLALLGVAYGTRWRREPVAIVGRRLRLPIVLAVVVAAALLFAGMRSAHAIVTYAMVAFVLVSVGAQVFDSADAASRASRTRIVGGCVTHAGIALLSAAFMGSAFRATYEVSLTAGETYAATDPFGRQWRFVSQGISTYPYRNSEVTAVALELLRDGESAGFVTSERREYLDTQGRPIFQPSTESAIHSEGLLDVYVVLAHVHDEVAEMQISFNPLVMWVWIGGALVILGGVLVALSASLRGVIASQQRHADATP